MFRRFSWVSIFALLLFFAPAANAFVYGFEEKLVPIKELPAEEGDGWSVGYYVRSAHVLFIPVFEWGGEFCLYKGERYLKVSQMDPEIKAIYDRLAGFVSVPFWHKMHLTNFLLPGLLSLLFLLGWRQRADQILREGRLMALVERDQDMMRQSADPQAPAQKFEIPFTPLSSGPGSLWLSPRDLSNRALASVPSTVHRGPAKHWKTLAIVGLFGFLGGAMMLGTLDSAEPTGVGVGYFCLCVCLGLLLVLLGQRATVRFEDGKVSYDGRTLWLRDQWVEPLGNYDGLRIREIRSKTGECAVILVHPVEARSLTLFSSTSPMDLAAEQKRLSELLAVQAL